MSNRSSGSYGHRVTKVREDEYIISWTHDRYFPGSRLRHPQRMSRDTNTRGAMRFAKKHKISFPGVKLR